MHDKIAILKKKIDRYEQYSRRSCILLDGIPESKGEVTDDVAVKKFFENINDNIIFVADIDRSQKIGTQNPQNKNLKPL